LRIDQLMAFAWKVMVPMSFLTIVMTAVYQFYGWPAWSLTAMSTTGLVVVGIVIYKKMTAPSKLVAETRSRQAALEAQRRAPATGGGD
jgi:heme exporter protein D